MAHAIGIFNGNWKHQWKRDIEDRPRPPLPADHEYSRYWAVYRKAARKTKKNHGWVFVAYIQATKAEMADIFRSDYGKGYRLRHLFSYDPKHAQSVARS